MLMDRLPLVHLEVEESLGHFEACSMALLTIQLLQVSNHSLGSGNMLVLALQLI